MSFFSVLYLGGGGISFTVVLSPVTFNYRHVSPQNFSLYELCPLSACGLGTQKTYLLELYIRFKKKSTKVLMRTSPLAKICIIIVTFIPARSQIKGRLLDNQTLASERLI